MQMPEMAKDVFIGDPYRRFKAVAVKTHRFRQ